MLRTDHLIGVRGRARRHRDGGGVTRWWQSNGDVAVAVTAVTATPCVVGLFALAGIPLGFFSTHVTVTIVRLASRFWLVCLPFLHVFYTD